MNSGPTAGSPVPAADGDRKAIEGADAALHPSEQRFRALVQHASDVVLVLGMDGTVTYVSPSAERLFGLSAEALVGSNGALLVHPEDLLTTLECFARITEPGASTRAEYRVVVAGGERRYVETVFTNLLHEPAVAGFVLNSRDVTERTEADARLRASEERYRIIVETAEEGVWAVDAHGVTTFVNERMAAMLGCTVEELTGRSIFDFAAGAPERTEAAARLERQRQGLPEQFDWQLVRDDGASLWVLANSSPIFGADGEYAGALAMITDITARKQAEDERRHSQQQLNAAQRLSSTGSWDRDLRTGFMRWSDELVRILGLQAHAEPSFEALMEACHPDDRGQLGRIRHRALANGRDDGEFRVVRHDGRVRVLQCVMEAERDAEGVPVRLTGAALDVTERKELEETLKRQALHDNLTGLPNRVLFLDRVEHALDRRTRSRESLSVLFVDLDDFKTVNDSLGHGAGDRILVEVAQRLLASLRPADTVARLGGDEFAVLLEGADQTVAESAATRVLAALERPVPTCERDIVVHASIGIAVASDAAGPEELLRDADAAMYAAKSRLTPGRYRVFEPSMHAAARSRLELRAHLQAAVAEGQMVVAYQPLVRLDSEAVVGVEALVRWAHPERGLVSPAEFIPLAEESGLIVSIGRHVLRTATTWVQRVNGDRSGPPLHVAVNLSPRQLLEPDFLEMIDDVLGASRLDPSLLVLEITETVLVEEKDTVVPLLSRLRQRGVKVAADDFGTGYSSLSYLRHLPIDVLKIDRSFVTDIARSAEDVAVAQAVVQLAQVLGHVTVGEGIETREQAATLLAIGCTFGQGFLFSPPRSGPDLESQLLGAPDRISLSAGLGS